MRQLSVNKFYLFLVFLVFLPNVLTSNLMELTYDEAYYWVYSNYLAWGYYDHPPLVALLIKLGTAIFGSTELGVRFFSNVSLIVALILMWKMVGKKNLLVFALLFGCMPLVNFSGVLSLPDSGLLIAVVFYFYRLQKFIDQESFKNVCLLALSIAFMFYAKYHGLLIVILTLMAHPSFLRNKRVWQVVFITTLLYLPHIYWQYQNDFISFKFHLFGRREKHFSFSNISNYVLSQIFLMGFLCFFQMIFSLKKHPPKNLFDRILLFNSFGFLVILLILSMRNQIEANWTLSVSIALILYFTPRLSDQKKRLIITASISILLITGIRGALIFAPELSRFEYGHENRINEIVGWKTKRVPLVKKFCSELPIVADNYQFAAKISFYAGREVPALHLNSRKSQFSLLNLEKDLGATQKICFISTKNLGGAVKINTFYKDPLYILTPTDLNFLARRYNTSYEEIIRN